MKPILCVSWKSKCQIKGRGKSLMGVVTVWRCVSCTDLCVISCAVLSSI